MNALLSQTLYPIMRPERMIFLIAASTMANRSVWIHGNSGIGKSQMVYAAGRQDRLRKVAWGKWLVAHGHSADDTRAAWEAWQKAYNKTRPENMPEAEFPYLEVIHLTIPQHEAEDFVGVPKHKAIPNLDYEDWVTTWAPVEVFRRPVPVILFLDEVSAADSRTQKVLLQLVQEHRIANVSLSEGTITLLAGNLLEDRAQLKTVPFTLGNRCAHFILKISPEAWLLWAEQMGLPGVFRAWVQQRRIAALHGYSPDNPSLAQLTPRSLEGAALSWREAKTMPDCLPEDLEALICANIGNGKGAELIGFLELGQKVATWEEVIADPHRAKLPEQNDLSMIYYTCGMLLDHLVERSCPVGHMASAASYAERVFKANTGVIDAAAWLISEILKLMAKSRPMSDKQHGMAIVEAISGNAEFLANKASRLLAAARA